jgi:hypothetical protein
MARTVRCLGESRIATEELSGHLPAGRGRPKMAVQRSPPNEPERQINGILPTPDLL